MTATRTRLLSASLLVATVLTGFSHASAQELPHSLPPTPLLQAPRTSWTDVDGISFGQILAITQDTEGFLWLGTTAGLFRFDGVNFVRWESLHRPPLPSQFVTALAAGRDGSLWIGSVTGGVVRAYGGAVDTFGPADGVANGFVYQILEGRDGTVWVAAAGGLSRRRGDRWERIGEANGLTDSAVYGVYEDRKGRIWVGSAVGVFQRASPADDHFGAVARLRFAIRSFSEGPEGIATISRLAEDRRPVTHRAGGSLVTDLVRNYEGYALTHDRQGHLWVGTSGGLLRVATDSSTHGAAVERLTKREGLSGDSVRALFEDREGNLWVGTDNGLDRMSITADPAISSNTQIPADLAINAVASTRDGSVWIATANGLYQFKGSAHKRFDRNDGLPSELILALTTDVHDTLWIATKDGVSRWDGRRFALVPVPNTLKFAEVTTLIADLEGGLWFGTREPGVYRWRNNALALIDVGPALIGTAGTVDRSGRVWIGFEDGSIAVHFQNHIQRYARAEGLPAALIRAIYEDSTGTIWVGSSAGLSRLQGNRFTTLTSVTADVPLRDVIAILVDREDYLWLATSAGIVRLRRDDVMHGALDGADSAKFIRYDASDGIPGNTVVPKHPAAAIAADGKLWFIASHGVAIIDTKAVTTQAHVLPLRIEGGIADGDVFTAAPRLTLPARTSTLQINYVVTALSAPSKIRFRYKLDGFDKTWIEAGARREAFYTNLPPAAYQFIVQAYDGLSTATTTWPFAISPAFYQTQWFRALIGLALLAAIGGVVWVRTFQVRKRFAVVLDERARIAREIHDTALQGMASVAMKLESLVKKIDRAPASATGDVRRLRRQIEQQIDETRRSVLNLRSPAMEPRTLPVTLREFADHFGADQPCHIEVAVTGQPQPCGGEVDHELLRIAQEAVRNSVQHGKARNVRIDVGYDHTWVRLCIADDGCGFILDRNGNCAQQNRQWGLKGMQERAKRIGGQFAIISTPESGTRVETVVRRRATNA